MEIISLKQFVVPFPTTGTRAKIFNNFLKLFSRFPPPIESINFDYLHLALEVPLNFLQSCTLCGEKV